MSRSVQKLISVALVMALVILASQHAEAQAKSVGEFKVISEETEGGVTEMRFDVEVNGNTVPGILWRPGCGRARSCCLAGVNPVPVRLAPAG